MPLAVVSQHPRAGAGENTGHRGWVGMYCNEFSTKSTSSLSSPIIASPTNRLPEGLVGSYVPWSGRPNSLAVPIDLDQRHPSLQNNRFGEIKKSEEGQEVRPEAAEILHGWAPRGSNCELYSGSRQGDTTRP